MPGFGWWSWCWQGQTLQHEAGQPAADRVPRGFLSRHRRALATALPALLANLIWWSVALRHDLLGLFLERAGASGTPRWYLSVTMVGGAMVAGATSEGGASVAFPVMTLAFGIQPAVARDFSLMIQSAGMTAAAASLVLMRVKVERRAVLWCSLGGAAGMVFGLEQVAPRLPPAFSKMYFVTIWAAFAASLFLLNRLRGRTVFEQIPGWELGRLQRLQQSGQPGLRALNWKATVLLLAGFVGGIFSSVAGSGIDICAFACLTLLFRLSEKVATPTSVLLMAINTVVGFGWRQLAMGGVEADAWGFFAVCVPIVVVCAPLGSLLGSHLHRLVLAAFVYVTDLVQLVGALAIVRPWTTKSTDSPLLLCVTSCAFLLCGGLGFRAMTAAGERLARSLQTQQTQMKQKQRQTPSNPACKDDSHFCCEKTTAKSVVVCNSAPTPCKHRDAGKPGEARSATNERDHAAGVAPAPQEHARQRAADTTQPTMAAGGASTNDGTTARDVRVQVADASNAATGTPSPAVAEEGRPSAPPAEKPRRILRAQVVQAPPSAV